MFALGRRQCGGSYLRLFARPDLFDLNDVLGGEGRPGSSKRLKVDVQLLANGLGCPTAVGAGFDDDSRPAHQVAAGVDAVGRPAAFWLHAHGAILCQGYRAILQVAGIGRLPDGIDDRIGRQAKFTALHRNGFAPAVAAGFAQLVVEAFQSHDPAVLGQDANGGSQWLEDVALGKEGLFFLVGGRHFVQSAAIDHRHRPAGEPLCRAGGVHGGVAAANDQHSLAQRRFFAVGHPLQQIQGAIDSLVGQSFDAQAGVVGKTGAEIDGVKALFQQGFRPVANRV